MGLSLSINKGGWKMFFFFCYLEGEKKSWEGKMCVDFYLYKVYDMV